MADGLLDAIRDHGALATLYAAHDEYPPPPRIEVWISELDVGNAGLRSGGAAAVGAAALAWMPVVGLAGTAVSAAGTGSLSVHCRVYEPGKTGPSYDHIYTRDITGGAHGAANTSRSLADTIINDVFTDKPPSS